MKPSHFSKFKKLASDKDKTTFLHPDGHEIKIAHSRLSPDMKNELIKLPIHKAKGGMIKKYADGGDTSSDDQDSSESHKGVVINIGNPNPAQDVAALENPPAPAYKEWKGPGKLNRDYNPMTGPAAASTQDLAVNNAQQQPQYIPGQAPQKQPSQDMDQRSPAQVQDNSTPQDAAANSEQTTDNVQSPAVPQGQQEQPAEAPQNNVAQSQDSSQIDPVTYQHGLKNELNQEDQKWAQDLANQHITPKTYGDLFAEKGTLGKIGMIFGMLASGAGSGLAHQQNNLMQVLNSEISNDLESQKQK